jgi:hypothetical protein
MEYRHRRVSKGRQPLVGKTTKGKYMTEGDHAAKKNWCNKQRRDYVRGSITLTCAERRVSRKTVSATMTKPVLMNH